MRPFVSVPKQVPSVEQYMVSFNVGLEQAMHYHAQASREEVYQNDVYEVSVSQVHISHDFPACIHLTIGRLDKQPVRSWADMQAIKNELVGPEHEGFEVFPAESRLVDMAPQYHLWVFAQEGTKIPIGWGRRQVRCEVFPNSIDKP